MAFCRNCGKEIKDSDAFCVNCGSSQNSNPNQIPVEIKTNNSEDLLNKQHAGLWSTAEGNIGTFGGFAALCIPFGACLGALICFSRGQNKLGGQYVALILANILLVSLINYLQHL